MRDAGTKVTEDFDFNDTDMGLALEDMAGSPQQSAPGLMR